MHMPLKAQMRCIQLGNSHPGNQGAPPTTRIRKPSVDHTLGSRQFISYIPHQHLLQINQAPQPRTLAAASAAAAAAASASCCCFLAASSASCCAFLAASSAARRFSAWACASAACRARAAAASWLARCCWAASKMRWRCWRWKSLWAAMASCHASCAWCEHQGGVHGGREEGGGALYAAVPGVCWVQLA